MRHFFFAAALLSTASLTACTNESADSNEPAEELTDESALTSIRTVHQGEVRIVGSYRYRVLYIVDTAAGRELRTVALTGSERTLVTLPAASSVGLDESADEGKFLVRHEGGLGIADLKASTPTWTDVVANPNTRRAVLRAGVVMFPTTSATFAESNLFVRAADGTIRQAPGTAWGDRYKLSPDGKQLAYWSNRTLSLFFTSTGASVSTPSDAGADDFGWVNGTLVFSNPSGGELWKLDASGAKNFYSAPVASSDFEWFLRPDGKIYAATHWGLQNPGWTQAELVDATTGEGEFFSPAAQSPSPHYLNWRSVESKDRRFLLDWYQSSATSLSGDVWLHDLTASPRVASRKLATVDVGWFSSTGKVGFGMRNTLGERCRFVDGGFVRCTKNDADKTGQLFALAPSSVTCTVTSVGPSCTNGDLSVTGTTATRPRTVGTAPWFNGRFAFEERVGNSQRLSLIDPKTGGTEVVVDRTCREGSFQVSTTSTRLFVADCTGLHIAR